MKFFQVQVKYEAWFEDCSTVPVAMIVISTHRTKEEAEEERTKCNNRLHCDKDFRADVLGTCPRFFNNFSFVVVEV